MTTNAHALFCRYTAAKKIVHEKIQLCMYMQTIVDCQLTCTFSINTLVDFNENIDSRQYYYFINNSTRVFVSFIPIRFMGQEWKPAFTLAAYRYLRKWASV